MSIATAAPTLLHVSLVVGGRLVDDAGGSLGRVEDVIVRLGVDEYPPVTGVVSRVAGREVFVPAGLIESIVEGAVTLRAMGLDLKRFERRPDEVLLKRDVLDRQLINVDGARLVRASEIELARVEGWYRVVGVDTGVRGFARRVVPRRLASRIGAGAVLDWRSVEPFTGHVPSLRLRVAHPKLARLHPAQLADLVEAASHREGAEILAAVEDDDELRADVFEELDAQHQREFVEQRSDQEVAEVLARMEPDDAADLVGELGEQRREPVLSLLPSVQRRRVRALIGYDAATAGGLMSPDFICLYEQATKEEVLRRVARSSCPAESLAWIYTMNMRRQLRGAITLPDVIRLPDGAVLADQDVFVAPRVRTDADVEEVARLMTDYDLTVVPIVDEREQMLGVVTVDDVLELVLPRGWRRRFDLLGGD